MNNDSDGDDKALLEQLSAAVNRNSKSEFKGFMLFVTDQPAHLKSLNQAAHSDNVGLCLLTGAQDEAVKKYSINVDPSVKNTVLVYRNKKVTAKFVNWTPKDADKLQAAIDATCASN